MRVGYGRSPERHLPQSLYRYLVAIIDWYSRYVQSWEVSTTLELDNIFVERLWRSVKVVSGKLQRPDPEKNDDESVACDYLADVFERDSP